jgi:hypothetical protein
MSTENRIDDTAAGSSRQEGQEEGCDLEAHYMQYLCAPPEGEGGGLSMRRADEYMEDAGDDDDYDFGDDEMEDADDDDGQEGEETTTSGAGGDGNETTTSGERRRKDRRPNAVNTVRSEITEVDPASGLPT